MRALCILLVLVLAPSLVWASDDTVAIRAQVKLQVVGVVEQDYYGKYQRYVELDTLIAIGWLKPDEAVDCELELSWDRQRFVAVVQVPGATWYIDKLQAPNSFQGSSPITAKELLGKYYDLDSMDEVRYFRNKVEEPKLTAAMIKKRIHQVQLGVERWAVDHSGNYPLSIDDVVVGGYIDQGFYANPCTATNVHELNAKLQPLGEWSAGEFSYLPYIVEGNCVEYLLLAYTPDPNGGLDLNGDGVPDGVLIILTSGVTPGTPMNDDWYTAELIRAFAKP